MGGDLGHRRGHAGDELTDLGDARGRVRGADDRDPRLVRDRVRRERLLREGGPHDGDDLRHVD